MRRIERNLALALTDKGRALRAEAERIPAGIVERLGDAGRGTDRAAGALTRVIAASRQALSRSPGGGRAADGPPPGLE